MRLDKKNSVVGMKNVLKVCWVPKMGLFYLNWSNHPEFQLNLQHKNEKSFLNFWPPTPKKIWIFFSSKYRYGYLNESSWQAENVFSYKKKSSEIVPYPNEEHYWSIVYITQWRALFGYGTISDEFFLYQKTFSARQDDSFKYPYRYFWRKKKSKFFWGRESKSQKKIFNFMVWNQLKFPFLTFK